MDWEIGLSDSERWEAISTAVEVANLRIEQLGLQDVLCMLYMAWEAVLVDQNGKVLARLEGEPGEVCGALMDDFEDRLRKLLTEPL